MKNCDIFAQNIDCECSLELPHLKLAPTSFVLSKNWKTNVHPRRHQFYYRGIKHNFPFINIRKVPREVLKTEGEA